MGVNFLFQRTARSGEGDFARVFSGLFSGIFSFVFLIVFLVFRGGGGAGYTIFYCISLLLFTFTKVSIPSGCSPSIVFLFLSFCIWGGGDEG